jgi:hypothetical protein
MRASIFVVQRMNSSDYPLQEFRKKVKHNASGKDAEFPTVGSVSPQARNILLTEE